MKWSVQVAVLWAMIIAGSAAAAPQRKAARGLTAPTRSVSVAAHAIPATGILTADDLIAIAKLAAKAAKDQFSEDPSSKSLGREFSITLGNEYFTINYDKEEHEITVKTYETTDEWPLSRIIISSNYEGENGYGARATISRERGDVYGLQVPGESYDRTPFAYHAKIASFEF